MAQNDDLLLEIHKALGRLENQMENLTVDFRDEKNVAHESRAIIHRRLDDQSTQIGKLETTVAVSGHIDAQIRGEIQTLKATVESNHTSVQPAIEAWKRVRMVGGGVSFMMVAVGITAASIYAWAYDWAIALFRHWLRIP